jgi:IclR family transcriptional regulator, acetate operon repressor
LRRDTVNSRQPGDGGPLIQSVSRALAILQSVALSPNGLTVTEIVQAVGLNRPTAYHLLRTLVHDGFLYRGGERRYRLGLRVGALAEAFERQLAPGELLVPMMRALAEETGEAAYLAGRRSGEIVQLAAAPARHAVAVVGQPLGLLEHAHARASGKVMLAFAPKDFRDDWFRTHTLEKLTSKTITDRAQLEAELELVREQGYATNREELVDELCALAAPIDNGVLPFALALSAPRPRCDENFDQYLEALLRLAGRQDHAGRS